MWSIYFLIQNQSLCLIFMFDVSDVTVVENWIVHNVTRAFLRFPARSFPCLVDGRHATIVTEQVMWIVLIVGGVAR